jgi:hypothetical protein
MIKRFIYKTNEWYIRLPEIKGGIFYISLMLFPYCFLVIFLNALWAMLWIFLLSLWRLSYDWFKIVDEYKKNKNNS